jgi:hypothetical protein
MVSHMVYIIGVYVHRVASIGSKQEV